MTNILYIITDLNMGGTEKMVYETVTRIDRNKYNPIVCGIKGGGIYAQRLKEKGIKVIILGINHKIKFFSGIFKLSKLIKEENIKIIHSYLFLANIFARITTVCSGRACSAGSYVRPTIISSIRVMEKQKKYHIFLERLTSFLSDKIVVNSQKLKNFVIDKMKINPEKIAVIYNGIDLTNLLSLRDSSLRSEQAPQSIDVVTDLSASQQKRKELGLSSGDFVVGSVGRLHKQKGIRYLIESAILIKRGTKPGTVPKFLIVGEGPERKFLEKKVKKSGLENEIIFTGLRTNALEIISVLDIFVLSSVWEGTPNVILEAMALQKPIIATGVGGVPELIKDKVSGLLVKPENPENLAESIVWMINNYSKAEEMGKKAKEDVEKFFSIDKMIKETEKLYGYRRNTW